MNGIKETNEKPVENLIDDHGEEFDVTPGMDERGESYNTETPEQKN